MKDVLREPVELIDADLDEVAGGRGQHVHQFNDSVNAVSAGNNNNNGSGNIEIEL
jgi:hypothetical protein